MRLLTKIGGFFRNASNKVRGWIGRGGLDKAVETIHKVGDGLRPIAGHRGNKIIDRMNNAADGARKAGHQVINRDYRGAISTARDAVNKARG